MLNVLNVVAQLTESIYRDDESYRHTAVLLFTQDVTPHVSRADRLFSIAFTAQWRERTSCARDSRGARTLTNNLQRERERYYIEEAFIMDRSV